MKREFLKRVASWKQEDWKRCNETKLQSNVTNKWSIHLHEIRFVKKMKNKNWRCKCSYQIKNYIYFTSSVRDCTSQLAYAFVPLQLKPGGARAVVRPRYIDASLAAGRLLRAFVDVWAKANSVQLRLSDIVFSQRAYVSDYTRTYTGITVESISCLALATIAAQYVGAFVALANTCCAFVDV